MSDKIRTIHTGLYSDYAHTLLMGIMTHLKSAFSNAKQTKKTASLLNTVVRRETDNEIVFESVGSGYNYSYRKKLWNGLTDNQVLRHIVWLYKLQLQKTLGKDAWKRSNLQVISDTTNFKLNEVYFLYDMFHQRSNFKRNYPESYSDMLIGMPLDPITVELKNTYNAEIKRIENELQFKLSTLDNRWYDERDAAYKAIKDKYMQLKADAKAEAEANIKKIKDEMNGITSVSLLADAS